jgi:hypothetical protein
MHQLIHNNDKIKMLRLAEQIENLRPLWISPGQSTFCRKFTFRALVESFELIDFIVYLFRQYTMGTPISRKKSRFQFLLSLQQDFAVFIEFL